MDFAETATVLCRYDHRDQLLFPQRQTRPTLPEQLLEILGEAGCRIRVDREGPNPVLAMMTTDQVETLASSWPSAGTSSLAIEPGAMKCESGMRFSHGCNA